MTKAAIRVGHRPGSGAVYRGDNILLVSAEDGSRHPTREGVFPLAVDPAPVGRRLGPNEGALPLIVSRRAPLAVQLAFLFWRGPEPLAC